MGDGFLAHYLRPLRPLIEDPAAIEIAINADGRVWIERSGASHMVAVATMQLRPHEVSDLAAQIANEVRQPLTEQMPMVSATIASGPVTLRAQVLIPPAVAQGAVIALRLFRARGTDDAPRRFGFLRPPERSSEAERQARVAKIRQLLGRNDDPDAFLRAAIDMHLNILVSGGTSTGKTELARRLQWMISERERLVLIEDAPELMPAQPNHVSLIATRDDTAARSAERLLQATLRLRPDRIILGELRGREAVTYLSAINSGHGGSFTTLHAETARKALDKLALLVLQTGTQLSFAEVLRYLRGSIDVVIQAGRVGAERGILEVWFPGLEINEEEPA
ncbi:ATPase, T2SS/T4P/T4SS family [Paracoccus laeviglucosivorans]|uniref:Type IV secretion system protein VirB11 n=1 Tax=Paracoccus laeviglucosivorans TaxID=1197861 RepID=A0A521FSN0_9RHOB|nr:ATPase, T2SS/T4P/T4SS family [Paracoccus laeviglucosivorans]SMO99162.1 type IV secretion system protein VirB11 [Paracoccus laeviglucosivorans]